MAAKGIKNVAIQDDLHREMSLALLTSVASVEGKLIKKQDFVAQAIRRELDRYNTAAALRSGERRKKS